MNFKLIWCLPIICVCYLLWSQLVRVGSVEMTRILGTSLRTGTKSGSIKQEKHRYTVYPLVNWAIFFWFKWFRFWKLFWPHHFFFSKCVSGGREGNCPVAPSSCTPNSLIFYCSNLSYSYHMNNTCIISSYKKSL